MRRARCRRRKRARPRLSSADGSLAADGVDGVVFGATTIADVGYEVVCSNDAEGKKCKDYVHNLLLFVLTFVLLRPAHTRLLAVCGFRSN